MRLLVKNARQAVLICSNGQKFLKSQDIGSQFVVLENTSIAIDHNGLISKIGLLSDITQDMPESQFGEVIDASGKCVIPGLVDGHTHAVWAGDRVHEFAMKLKGASYMEIHKAGGGIGFTVGKTRAASEDTLVELYLQRLGLMLRNGTTLVESKSGYGLDTETEIKMLRVIERAKSMQPVDISSTYCGAHSVPKGMNELEATHDVLTNQIPAVVDAINKGEISVDSIDVFCEKGVYEVETSKQILEAGKKNGMMINFHAEELNYIGGVEMGTDIGATAISHLEEISDEGIKRMASTNAVAVILPTTAHILKLKLPPVRQMLEEGVIVALGTDFNPNAYCVSMITVMNLACIMFRMSMEESIVAATLNAAASIQKSNMHGSIEVGKWGDLVLFDAPRWEHVIYQMNASEIVSHVIKKGEVVFKK